MLYRFSASALMWMTLLISITSLAAIYSSFPDEDTSDLYTSESQLLDSTARTKRMGQISCRCCSNSFNSHCCLRCMQRLGKRQESSFARPQTAFESMTPAIDDFGADYPAPLAGEWPVSGRACTCCLYQMKINPFVGVTACCEQCRSFIY